MAITLEIKVYENDDLQPDGKRFEVTGIARTLLTNNVNQALQLLRNDMERIIAGPVEKDDE
jgi:hypothetical protein